MIKKLADENLKVNLALSFLSEKEDSKTSHNIFTFLVTKKRPTNKKVNKSVTFEYIIWKGINDNLEEVRALVNFCRKFPSKVNLIEYNPIGDDTFEQASNLQLQKKKKLILQFEQIH